MRGKWFTCSCARTHLSMHFVVGGKIIIKLQKYSDVNNKHAIYLHAQLLYKVGAKKRSKLILVPRKCLPQL